MRPFRHPTAPKRQAPMGRGCRPTVNFYIQIERQEFIQSKIIDRVADEDDDLVFVEQKKKLVVDVRDKDDLELYYKTIPDYFARNLLITLN